MGICRYCGQSGTKQFEGYCLVSDCKRRQEVENYKNIKHKRANGLGYDSSKTTLLEITFDDNGDVATSTPIYLQHVRYNPITGEHTFIDKHHPNYEKYYKPK
jgi:hypothetical protein